MTCKICKICNRSSLSLLLLRPSPIAKFEEPIKVQSGGTMPASLRPKGMPKDELKSVKPLVETLMLGKYDAKASEPALRLLREGYVHIYFPKIPESVKESWTEIAKIETLIAQSKAGEIPGNKVKVESVDPHWLSYRVTAEGELYSQRTIGFKSNDSRPCTDCNHNSHGVRTIELPKLGADELGDIWIAYSANMWNETTKRKNKASSVAMNRVNLSKVGLNTFKPTEKALKESVLEFALTSLEINGLEEHQYPFPKGGLNAEKMAKQLKLAAGIKDEPTKGKELAIVLPDPVSYAAELNQLRVWRHQIQLEFAKLDEYMHPYRSIQNVEKMREIYREQALSDGYKAVCPLINKTNFNRLKSTYPTGTIWEKRATKATRVRGGGVGYVIKPKDHIAARKWAEKDEIENWNDNFKKYFDNVTAEQWLKDYDKELKEKHVKYVNAYEKDWSDAIHHQSTMKSYFKYHFDENESNTDNLWYSAGEIYRQESDAIHQPHPFSSDLTDTYLSMWESPITDEGSIVQRAMLGNQKNLIDEIHEQLTAGVVKGAKNRKKVFGLLKKFAGTEVGERLIKHSWLTNAMAASSLGQVSALTAALGTLAHSAMKSERGEALRLKVKQFQFIQQLAVHVNNQFDLISRFKVENAIRGTGNIPTIPITITKEVSLFYIMNAGVRSHLKLSHEMQKAIVDAHKNNRATLTISILTDTHQLQEVGGDLYALIQNGNAGVGAASSLTMGAVSNATFSEAQFHQLRGAQTTHMQRFLQKALNSVDTVEAITNSNTFKVINSMDGYLAVGSLMFQVITGYDTLAKYLKETDPSKKEALRYALIDGGVGLVSASSSLVEVVSKTLIANAATRAAAHLGTEAAEKAGKRAVSGSLSILRLRFTVGALGAVGGYMQWQKNLAARKDSLATGDFEVARLQSYSAAVGLGLVGVSVVEIVGAIADYLSVTRNGVMAAKIASRIAPKAVLISINTGRYLFGARIILTTTGIGFVLVLVSLGIEYAIYKLTPTPLQHWIRRSYFSTPTYREKEAYQKGEWEIEQTFLQEALGLIPENDKIEAIAERSR